MPGCRAVGPLCECTVRPETEPAPALVVSRRIRGTLELTRGHDGDALVAIRTAERLAGPWPPRPISSANADTAAASPGTPRRARTGRTGPRRPGAAAAPLR